MKKNLQNDSKYNKEFAKADSLFLTNKKEPAFWQTPQTVDKVVLGLLS